jgi:hypothetical protein
MTRIIDVNKVQEALDRAARQAVHGTHEVRAGRFVAGEASASLPRGKPRLMSKAGSSSQSSSTTVEAQIEGGRRIARRLREEARRAQRGWALWEAFNGDSSDHRKDLREALGYLGLSGQAEFLQSVLARDALLAIFRMTDQARDGFSLCAIARLLWDDLLCATLSDPAWLLKNGYPDFVVDFETGEQPKRIQFIRNLVSPRWSDQCPKEPTLYGLRAKLKDVRDRMLAHPLDSSGIVQPSIDEVRQFLQLTAMLVEKTELVFFGSAQATINHFDVRLKEAAKLWDYFGEGPIHAHRHDTDVRRKAGIE